MQLAVILAMISWPLALVVIVAAVYLQKNGMLKLDDVKGSSDAAVLSGAIGQFQMRTQSLLIALTIVAFLGACLLPGLALYLDFLAAGRDPAISLEIETTAENRAIELGAPGVVFPPGSPINVLAFRSTRPVDYALSGLAVCPTSISVWYSIAKHALMVKDNTHQVKTWEITDMTHPVLTGPPLAIDATGCPSPTHGVANVASPTTQLREPAPPPPSLR